MDKISKIKLNNNGVTYGLNDEEASRKDYLDEKVLELTAALEALTARVAALEYDQHNAGHNDSSTDKI